MKIFICASHKKFLTPTMIKHVQNELEDVLNIESCVWAEDNPPTFRVLELIEADVLITDELVEVLSWYINPLEIQRHRIIDRPGANVWLQAYVDSILWADQVWAFHSGNGKDKMRVTVNYAFEMCRDLRLIFI